MSITVKGKVALVTGANRGIGKAIVESFINHGASKVYLAVRDPKSTKAMEAQYGDKVVTIQADLSDMVSISKLAEQAADVDIVVNNAGLVTCTSLLDASALDTLTREIDVNVFGLLRVASAFAKTLIKRKGALVQLNSIVSLKNIPLMATYSASKAAAYSLTQALRWELKDKGVIVLSVHPGPIATKIDAAANYKNAAPPACVSEGIVHALEAGEFHLFPDNIAKQIEAEYQSFSDNCVMTE